MFDYEVRSTGFSPTLFVIQLILAPLGGLILGLLVYALLEEVFRARNSNLLGYIGFSIQGFILGYKMQTAFPRAIESWGPWIWTVPVCNVGLWILNDNGPNSQVADFFVFPHGPGLGGIEMVLITWPAVASCFYSFGVIVASRTPQTSWQHFIRRGVFRERSNDGDRTPTV